MMVKNKVKKYKQRVKSVSVATVIFLISLLIIGWANNDDTVKHTRTIYAMDTQMDFTVYESEKADSLTKVDEEVSKLEHLLSTTDRFSEIYAINHEHKPIPVSPETQEVLQMALAIAKQTDGVFDPTIYPIVDKWGFTTQNYHVMSDAELKNLLPLVDYRKINLAGDIASVPSGIEIDLGAIGKGYTGDKIIELLKREGVCSALINLGGNVQALGNKPDGSSWRIGLKSPDSDDNLAVLEIANKAVITSGGYERYFKDDEGNVYWHILDPKTGKPAHSGLISTTVIGDKGAICDALSTAFFIMGKDKAIDFWRKYYSANNSLDMILITDDHEIYITENMAKSFILEPKYANYPVHVVNAHE